MKESLKGYMDLTRIHFWFVWPLLFCSGLMLAFRNYGGFSWGLTVKAALIGLFGFEAGFVLNDYVDRDLDKKDVEFDKLTKYWRPFKERPLPSGLISPRRTLILFFVLFILAAVLVATLPYPHNVYLFAAGIYCYSMEYFYQIVKRNQKFPLAQLLGRTDFVLFPVAGYLCYGHPDETALLYFVFFYPLALVHLGINDIIDVKNDEVKQLKTIPVLYGMKGTALWILFFTVMHFVVAPFFLIKIGTIAMIGFLIAFLLLATANYKILREKSSEAGLRVLPLFHVTMLTYASSIIVSCVI